MYNAIGKREKRKRTLPIGSSDRVTIHTETSETWETWGHPSPTVRNSRVENRHRLPVVNLRKKHRPPGGDECEGRPPPPPAPKTQTRPLGLGVTGEKDEEIFGVRECVLLENRAGLVWGRRWR